MNYRLIALDLDGTLLNTQKEITQDTKDAIALANQKGIHVVLSTGRIVKEAVEFAREIDCEDLMVTSGGAAIASAAGENHLFDWSMSIETGARVVEEIQNRPVRMMIYIGNKIYINPYSNRDFLVNYRVEGFHANKIVLDDIAAHIRENRLRVAKAYALGEREVLDEILREIRPLPGITITSSGNDNFEVMPAGVDKGTALLRLGQMLGIRSEEMAAIGDSDNDAAMLQAVGLPIAMGNAEAGVRQLAQYVTADCDHDGVAQAIYHILRQESKI